MTDSFDLRAQYRYLRVADVCDALDGIGYFGVGLMDPEVRPLWTGMRFWGVAFTIRPVGRSIASAQKKLVAAADVTCAVITMQGYAQSLGPAPPRGEDHID